MSIKRNNEYNTEFFSKFLQFVIKLTKVYQNLSESYGDIFQISTNPKCATSGGFVNYLQKKLFCLKINYKLEAIH